MWMSKFTIYFAFEEDSKLSFYFCFLLCIISQIIPKLSFLLLLL